MDSTGIRMILAQHGRLESAGGHLRIVAKPGSVYNLLEIAGVVQGRSLAMFDRQHLLRERLTPMRRVRSSPIWRTLLSCWLCERSR
jgi:hypothetical protein